MSSKSADSSADISFASFFQNCTEADLIDQVEWSEEKLGLSDAFYSSLLRIEADAFSRWKTGKGPIEKDSQDDLSDFWQTLRHILSFLNFNLDLVCVMLEHTDVSNTAEARLSFRPPWIGTSIKAYLEATGRDGVRKVNEWIQAVRFSDP